MHSTRSKLIPALVALVILAGLLLASCEDTDVMDDSEATKLSGYVETITVDGNDTITPAEGGRVEFAVDPGENTLEDLVTFVDANGHYELQVKMYEDARVPVRYTKSLYYEQSHYVSESDGNQTLDVLLVSTEEPADGRNCEAVCDREMNCEFHFEPVYQSTEECLDHCRTGCETDSYLNCAFHFGEETNNANHTCEGVYACFGTYCDDSWRDTDDDDDDDDDSEDAE